jgi:hypothetical protein
MTLKALVKENFNILHTKKAQCLQSRPGSLCQFFTGNKGLHAEGRKGFSKERKNSLAEGPVEGQVTLFLLVAQHVPEG